MRVRRAAVATAAATALAVPGVQAVSAVSVPASAAFTTRCVGVGGAVTVPGDLVVPAGAACTLNGTTVEGDVRVARGADLIARDAVLEGDVTLERNAYLVAYDTQVDGGVAANRSFGAYLEDGSVGEDVAARGAGLVFALGTDVEGDLRARQGEFFADGVEIGGDVEATRNLFADVIDTIVAGDLSVDRAENGSQICFSWVDGDVDLTRNQEVLQVGADGPFDGCEGNIVEGDVTIADNTGDIRVSNNAIRGDLDCTDNSPAPTGSDNRVRGERTGQCAELATEPETLIAADKRPSTQSGQSSAAERGDTRRADAEQRLAERGEHAQREAEAHGPADL